MKFPIVLACWQCGARPVVLRPNPDAPSYEPLCYRHGSIRLPGDIDLTSTLVRCRCGGIARGIVFVGGTQEGRPYHWPPVTKDPGRWVPFCAPPTPEPRRVWWLPFPQLALAPDISLAGVDLLDAVSRGLPVVALKMPCMLCDEDNELVPLHMPLCGRCRGI
jgi:hypothetical protein